MSRNRYQSIFETTLDGIIVINDKGLIEDINSSAEHLFNYSKEELLGKNISVLMPQPDRSQHDQYIKNYQSTRKPKIIGIGREVEGQKKDKSVFPFRLAVSEFAADGKIFYTGIIHDLTKQKEHESIISEYAEHLEEKVRERTAELAREIELKQAAENALKDSQKLYVTIAKNYPNGSITVLDPSFRVIFAEGSEFKNLGINTDDLIGQSYLDYLPTEHLERIKQNLNEVLEGAERIFEYNYVDRINRARSLPLLYDEEGKVSQVLLVENNITHEKRAEKEIYAALTKEKQLNELKTKFVSMASHEFRTPLTSILSSAALVGKYTKSEQQDNRLKHLQKISLNVQNLTMILNDFLSLERIEGGLINNNPECINIVDFIKEMQEDAEPMLKDGQVIIVKTELKNENFNIDLFLLRNMLNNLISNAIKYSNSSIIITISDTDQLIIAVKDAGIGISEEDQENLFNRFFRGSNAGQIQGTGLGLNIVKRYASIMGGEINFESKLNEGSTFAIKLYDTTV